MKLFEELCVSKHPCGQIQGPRTSVAYLRIENKTNQTVKGTVCLKLCAGWLDVVSAKLVSTSGRSGYRGTQ
jgi:hypothetical protein